MVNCLESILQNAFSKIAFKNKIVRCFHVINFFSFDEIFLTFFKKWIQFFFLGGGDGDGDGGGKRLKRKKETF